MSTFNERELQWLTKTFGAVDVSEDDWREKLKKAKTEYIKKNHPDATNQPATEEFLMVNDKEKWEEFESLLERMRDDTMEKSAESFSGVQIVEEWVDFDDPSWMKVKDKNGKTSYMRMRWK